MSNINFVKEKLKIEFEFVGDEKISGFTAMKIIDDVFEQFKAEQKPSAVSDEEIEKLAEKEFPPYHQNKRGVRSEISDEGRKGFIKGFKAAIQFKAEQKQTIQFYLEKIEYLEKYIKDNINLSPDIPATPSIASQAGE